MSTQTQQDWRDIPSDIHKKYAELYRLLGGSTVVIILLAIGGVLFANEVFNDYSTNVFTEFISVTTTIFVIDRLNQNRAQAQRKKDLLSQLRSKSNDFAKEAARLIKDETWHIDGILNGADLSYTNLQGADLKHANLQGANLESANLQGTELRDANLQDADLGGAQLQGAYLRDANLQGAYLRGASLEGANLESANLHGAKLPFTNLQRADLGKANLQGADLSYTDLKDASLFKAKLKGASLWEAKLESADLHGINLAGADLIFANLAGADLMFAKLQGAKNIDKAIFNESTTLPDGTKWTPDRMEYLIALTQQEPEE